MNKNELITFLRNPNNISEPDLGELAEIIENNPYFLSGRMLLAKGSKDLKHPETRKRVTSAAVYATDRPLFKKYLSDKLFFLSQPPEEEEIVQEIVTKKKIDGNISNKENSSVFDKNNSEQEQKKKETKETVSAKNKNRREPRFDPSATASFDRRWDAKSESKESTSEPTKTSKPTSKIVFAGKKIDRPKRERKKSIRSEILDDTPQDKSNKNPQSKTQNRDNTPITSTPASFDEKVTDKKVKKVERVKKEVVRPTSKKTLTPRSSEVPQRSVYKKSQTVLEEKKEQTENKKQVPLNKSKTRDESVLASKRTITKNRLNIPEVPSGRIDSILDELKMDMENLKSSRVKFTEVQQKIEEDDEFTAALERATKKIPTSAKSESRTENTTVNEQNVEKTQKPKLEDNQKEESLLEKEPIAEEEPVAETKESLKSDTDKKEEDETKKASTQEARTNLMPKAKKVSSTRKKSSAKETPTKKTATKKATSKKTASAKNPVKIKSTKSKSGKKDNSKIDLKTDTTKKKSDQSSIIDKFIAETPSIKYQKKSDLTENQDLSDPSTEWNKELASEYLAEIYLHQGNKKRAIEIYKALSLKFPNKKSYFADLISKTK